MHEKKFLIKNFLISYPYIVSSKTQYFIFHSIKLTFNTKKTFEFFTHFLILERNILINFRNIFHIQILGCMEMKN